MKQGQTTLSTHPATQFVNVAAGLLETDAGTLKARMKALGYTSIPGRPAERVAAYRRLRADLGHVDDIMQPAAGQQPPLVTVDMPATDYQE